LAKTGAKRGFLAHFAALRSKIADCHYQMTVFEDLPQFPI
jgi:hypothetical protein